MKNREKGEGGQEKSTAGYSLDRLMRLLDLLSDGERQVTVLHLRGAPDDQQEPRARGGDEIAIEALFKLYEKVRLRAVRRTIPRCAFFRFLRPIRGPLALLQPAAGMIRRRLRRRRMNTGSKDRAGRTMVIAAALLGLTAFCAGSAGATEMQAVAAGEYGFAFDVPAAWERSSCDGELSMRIHFRVRPIVEICGHFSVHVIDRGTSDAAAWAAFHRTRNIASAYGKHRIESEKDVLAGTLPARLFHATNLEGRPRYELWDALVVTGDRAIFLSYLCDAGRGAGPRGEMDAILASFSTSPEAIGRAKSWYRAGRTIGLEKTGLFLSLPRGWIPESCSTRSNLSVSLPSGGTLRVVGVGRVTRGLDGLRRILSGKVRGFPGSGRFEPFRFGPAGAEAGLCCDGATDGAVTACLVGLNGTSGFGLILDSADAKEGALLEKMAANATLLEPRAAERLRREAVVDLKRALRTGSADGARKALGTLVLFPKHSTTVRVIKDGLKSTEEIQVATLSALGRIGSRAASLTVESTLGHRDISERIRRACIEALVTMGGERERRILDTLGSDGAVRRDRVGLSPRRASAGRE